MTAAADSNAAAVTSSPAEPPRGEPTGNPPRLAPGTELVGEYEQSGLEDAPFIARRADGQLIQLPQLLYLVAERLDGGRSYEEIAQSVSQVFSKEVGSGDIHVLIEEKLAPLGLIAGEEAEPSHAARPDPLLALNLKTKVVPAALVRAGTTLFYPFFFPPVILGVLAAFLALDLWLFATHGVAQSFRHLINEPVLLLLVFGFMLLGTMFHEMGHATGCRYGGAEPGVMGVGLYIIWPAFYTDVNDAYRLGRWGRIRTDLGGVYFNAIFALAVAGLYFLTGFEPLLLVVIGQHFQMFQQFLPFLRLDGYYVVSDLTGVPDLFGRIGPILRSLVPGKEPDPKVTELKGWVRGVVTVWVVTTIPVLLFMYLLLIAHIPRLLSTGWVSFRRHSSTMTAAVGAADWSQGATAAIHIALLVLPTIGASYVLLRTAKRIAAAGWRATSDRPQLRGVLAIGWVVVVAVVAFALWPDADYRPIGRDERGTLLDATRTLARTPTDTEPSPSPSASPSPSPGASPGATDAARNPVTDESGSSQDEPPTGSAPDGSSDSSPEPSAEPSPTTSPSPIP